MHPESPDPGSSLDLTAAELAFLGDLEQLLIDQDIELRASERFPIAVEVRLTAVDHEPIDGRTVDISRGGLRAIFDDVPRIGMHYAVCVMGLQAEPVRTLGRCLRVSLLDGDRSEAVLHFSELLPEGGPLG